MKPVLILGAILAGLSALLALPPTLKERSWRTFLAAAAKSFAGIVLPLLSFFISMLLMPEWKGECRFGWADCFQSGKVALTPLVLWATAALYAVEIWQTDRPLRWWIVVGFMQGAIVSGFCSLHGMAILSIRLGPAAWGLAVPLYVAVWYAVRAAKLAKRANLTPASVVLSVLGSLPLWAWSFALSRKTYLKLPDHPPSCFVVTAASRGHACVVGPTAVVQHGGHGHLANRQLLTFWYFEHAWRESHPCSHARFRRLYDTWGPRLARKVTHPWMADLAYLALKPAEWGAGFLVALRRSSTVFTRFSAPPHPLPRRGEAMRRAHGGIGTARECADQCLPHPSGEPPSRGGFGVPRRAGVRGAAAESSQPRRVWRTS